MACLEGAINQTGFIIISICQLLLLFFRSNPSAESGIESITQRNKLLIITEMILFTDQHFREEAYSIYISYNVLLSLLFCRTRLMYLADTNDYYNYIMITSISVLNLTFLCCRYKNVHQTSHQARISCSRWTPTRKWCKAKWSSKLFIQRKDIMWRANALIFDTKSAKISRRENVRNDEI